MSVYDNNSMLENIFIFQQKIHVNKKNWFYHSAISYINQGKGIIEIF